MFTNYNSIILNVGGLLAKKPIQIQFIGIQFKSVEPNNMVTRFTARDAS